jgi:integrase
MHNFTRRDWHPALEAAGVDPRRAYDLRHSFASNALAAGISLYELSRFMGASVRVLEMHYAHLVPDAETPLAPSWTLAPQPFRPLVGPGLMACALHPKAKDAPEQGIRRVERTGIEPVTSGLQSRRSPS